MLNIINLELIVREEESLLIVLSLPGLEAGLVPGLLVPDVDEGGGGSGQYHAAGQDRGRGTGVSRNGDRGNLG